MSRNSSKSSIVPLSCGISVGSENSDGDSIFWTAPTTLDDYVARTPVHVQAPAAASAPAAPIPASAPYRYVPHRGSLRRVHHASAAPAALARQPSSASTSVSDEGQLSSSASKSSSSAAVSTSSAAPSFVYAISIAVPQIGGTYELKFERHEYDVLVRLFSILDSESRGSVGRDPIREFVRLRCPVFRRRDGALRSYGQVGMDSSGGPEKDTERTGVSQTFDEVWDSVVECSASPPASIPDATVELGLEGWMVFCRLVALAQYQEAKRRFSARHSQQTMRPKSGGRGSEVVLVSVPPPDPPEPLTARELAEHGAASPTPLSLPELDLDHCLVSAHDMDAGGVSLGRGKRAWAEIKVFGPVRPAASLLGSASQSSSSKGRASKLEFVVTFHPSGGSSSASSSTIVRRTFADMEWLHDTFALHKSAGGTLCGRILPPFPSRAGVGGTSSDVSGAQSSVTGSVVAASGSAAMAAASAGVGMIASVAKSAKSFLGGYVTSESPKEPSPGTSHGIADGGGSSGIGGSKRSKLGKLAAGIQRARDLGRSHGREKEANTSSRKARQLERYLNYLLEHPALSTSFPLNVILKASQSGLDSAKRMLDEHAKSNDRRRRQQQEITQADQEKPSASLSPSLLSLLPTGGSSSGQQPNLSWVRSAAQAAMALQLHGILETTGMPTASAKLQHASLPNFSSRKQSWGEDDGGDVGPPKSTGGVPGLSSDGAHVNEGADCFESGVVNVESGLNKGSDDVGDGEGYDLLPSPVPLPERSVLCAGSIGESDSVASTKANVATDFQENSDQVDAPKGYHYGSRSDQFGSPKVGSAAILGDMSVDNDIDKLREIIGSVDNVLSRCFAAGITIGRARRKEDALHLNIVRGLDSWEGMRGEIVSQRALLNGVSTLERGSAVSEESYSCLNDDLSWQASLATSAVSAAEDVRSAVRASRTATRAKLAAEAAARTALNACDAGKFSTADEARGAQTRASIAHSHAIHSAVIEHEALAAKRRAAMALAHDVKCWNVHRKRELLRTCREVARQQQVASHQATAAWTQLRDGLIGAPVVSVTDERRQEPISDGLVHRYDPVQTTYFSMHSSDAFGAEALPEPTDNVSREPCLSGSFDSSPVLSHSNRDIADVADESAPTCSAEPDSVPFAEASEDATDTNAFPFANDEDRLAEMAETKDETEHDIMTSSMQSLVDGLMNWGGQYDSQEDLSLPSGMAVSIALEESGILGGHGLAANGF